jgi:hypothetical protein
MPLSSRNIGIAMVVQYNSLGLMLGNPSPHVFAIAERAFRTMLSEVSNSPGPFLSPPIPPSTTPLVSFVLFLLSFSSTLRLTYSPSSRRLLDTLGSAVHCYQRREWGWKGPYSHHFFSCTISHHQNPHHSFTTHTLRRHSHRIRSSTTWRRQRHWAAMPRSWMSHDALWHRIPSWRHLATQGSACNISVELLPVSNMRFIVHCQKLTGRTIRNHNSSRFSKYTTLLFSAQGEIVGANTKVMILQPFS